MRATVWMVVSCLMLGLVGGCGVVPPSSGQSVYVGGSTSIPVSSVVVSNGNVPQGSQPLGPVEGISGSGCGLLGSIGNSSSSMLNLRQNAAMRGANFVLLLSTRGPEQRSDCLDQQYIIRGVAFRTPPTSASSLAAEGETCDPPCSPGYRCERQVCLALCNPSCGPGSVCRQDRTCGPDPASPPAAPASPNPLSPPAP